MATKVGTVLDGKYEILKQIGKGGMSIVYLAMDKRLNKQWAVKEIRKTASGKNNEVVVNSLLAEANLMKRLDHPALPHIVDIIDNDENFLIVMDYIEGKTLEKLINEGNEYDEVIAIGPLIMMKFVCLTTKKYGIKTMVSMNPIMIDGTGMCGGCRLTVGGETKFACVDGPDFDGHLVDFDEALHRGTMYKDFETHAREEACNLLKKGAE